MLLKIIKELLALKRRVRRLEKLMSDQAVTTQNLTDEIAQTKTDVETFKTNVAAKIAALSAQIAAGSIDGAAVKTALDDLKADIDSATV